MGETKMGSAESDIAGLNDKIVSVDTELDDVYKRLDDIDAVLDKMKAALEGSEPETAAAMANGGVIDSTSMISTANKDVLIYCLVIFNIGTIIGCISCLFLSKQTQSKPKGYVYDGVEENEIENLN